MFIVVGAISIIVAALGYLNPHVRNVEDELPDAIVPEQDQGGLDGEVNVIPAQEPAVSQVD
jgi:hypothetical protein